MNEDSQRREVSSRDTSWARYFARVIAQRDISPNTISKLSIGFALLGCLGMYLTATHSFCYVALIIVGIQGRLLCNLFDGMVAVEYGKKTAMGGVWNELPDRITDTLFFVTTGFVTGNISAGLALSLFAVLTAYLRLLGVTVGTKAYFSGPLAKQHRMAAMTVLWLLIPFVQPPIISYALWTLTAGTALTCVVRFYRIKAELCTSR